MQESSVSTVVINTKVNFKHPGRVESKKKVLTQGHLGLSTYLGYKETSYRTT